MSLKFQENILHEADGDFSRVKHLVLNGTNEEIGAKLGEIARFQHLIQRPKSTNNFKHSCQHTYLGKNYPIHFNRIKGLAKVYDDDIYKTNRDFSCFGNPLDSIACSAVFYPPKFTETKSGLISRNLDLPLTSFAQVINKKGFEEDIPTLSNLYIIEIYPDKGYSSLITLSFEVFGLALDGINSVGLSVVHLHADSINVDDYKPSLEYDVGINEMLVVQLLLDNCKDIKDAKEFLLINKHFYMLLPTHLLIADKNGESFVWEHTLEHNAEIIIDGNSEIQILTNFPLHKYTNVNTYPASKDKSCPFNRYLTMENEINKESSNISINRIKEINAKVFITDEMFDEVPDFPSRTIYHNIYDTNNRSMEISFYRKEDAEMQHRTGYYKIELK